MVNNQGCSMLVNLNGRAGIFPVRCYGLTLGCGAPGALGFSARSLYFCTVIILLSVIQVLSGIQSEAGASHSKDNFTIIKNLKYTIPDITGDKEQPRAILTSYFRLYRLLF